MRAPGARVPLISLALVVALAACGPTTPTDAPSAPPTVAASPSPSRSTEPASPGAPSASTGTVANAGQIDDLREAALASVAEGTVRMVYSIEFDGATTVQDGLFLSGRGQTSFGEPRRAHLSATLQNEAFGSYEMILDDRQLYLKGDVVAQIVPAGRWLGVDLDSNHRMVASFASLASGQNDSSLALFYVLGTTGDVRVSPGESIDGRETTRYATAIDLDEVRDRVPPELAEALETNIAALEAGGISPAIEAQVWVNTAGRVVRTRYVYTLGAGEGGGQLIGTYGFSDFGAPMDEVIPTEGEVISLEDAVAS